MKLIGLEIILIGLLAVSIFTGLTTEAIKVFCNEHNIKYRANTLAGIVAVALSIIIGAGYVVLTSTPFTSQVCVYLFALAFLGWLCAMVGYDKVMQAISQFKTSGKD